MEKIIVEYKKGFVAFIDVLGFKDMIYNPNQENNKVKKYLIIVNEQIMMLNKLQNFKSIIISDSIILSTEINEYVPMKNNILTLFILCNIIKTIQQNLAKNDIWLRGAISYGEIYFDDVIKQVIGKGYINAFLLESNYALYPRIILDNKLIDYLRFKTSEECITKINEYREELLYSWKRNASSPQDIDKQLNDIKKDVPLFIDFIEGLEENEIVEISNHIITNARKDIKIYQKFQ